LPVTDFGGKVELSGRTALYIIAATEVDGLETVRSPSRQAAE